MNQDRDPFLSVLHAYRDAVRAKDAAAFAALYDENVHVFDLWGAWSLRGLAAWRAMAEEWFASLGDEHVVVGIDAAESDLDGDLAVGHAFLTYTAFGAGGAERRSLGNRITMALRRRSGVWKVFHEHTSAPVEHASGKALLQRPRG